MTASQHRKYLSEWGLVRQVYRAKGLEPKACDAKRHELHKRALGRDKSSLDLTNSEFDAVLAVFSAISRPADLQTQLRLQEQAPERAGHRAGRALVLLQQLEIAEGGRVEYLDELCRRICGRPWARLAEIEQEKILGVLADRARRHIPKGEEPF
ncbi:MAG: hypothetical protein PHE83_05685 [Opitutaceae bacterium]|nr:hypothetical protein [Opitutaceae bacterium]